MKDDRIDNLAACLDRLQIELLRIPPTAETRTLLSHLEMAVESFGEGLDPDSGEIDANHQMLMRKYVAELETAASQTDLSETIQQSILNLKAAI